MFRSLELLRIFSAICVVTAHFPAVEIPVFSLFFSGGLFLGSIGVDVFFVISGVVMGLTFSKRTDDTTVANRISGFLIARVLRIYPLYIIATLAAVAISPVFNRVVPEMSRILYDLFLIPHQSNGYYIDPIIGAGWTLRYEVFFYLLVLIALVIRSKVAVPVMILTLVIIHPKSLTYYGNQILLEFLFGYFFSFSLHLRVHNLPTIKHKLFLAACFALFSLAALGRDFPPIGSVPVEIPRMLIYFNDSIVIPRVIAWGIPSALLVISLTFHEKVIPKRISNLGRYTYSLYIMQYFCLPVHAKLIGVGTGQLVATIFTIGALVVVTALSYRYVERPCLNLLGNKKNDTNRS